MCSMTHRHAAPRVSSLASSLGRFVLRSQAPIRKHSAFEEGEANVDQIQGIVTGANEPSTPASLFAAGEPPAYVFLERYCPIKIIPEQPRSLAPSPSLTGGLRRRRGGCWDPTSYNSSICVSTFIPQRGPNTHTDGPVPDSQAISTV
jgi:hypothetical protein